MPHTPQKKVLTFTLVAFIAFLMSFSLRSRESADVFLILHPDCETSPSGERACKREREVDVRSETTRDLVVDLPHREGWWGLAWAVKPPRFLSLSLYLILTQAVCRSCGTQCPSPRARTKSPRSRTARRSPPFSTSHRQSCSPSLSLCLASVAEVCASSRASWSKKVPFSKFKKISRIRKKKTEISGDAFSATRGGGGRKAYLPQWRSKASRGRGGEGTIPARCPESERGPYVLDKVEGIGIGRVLRHS